MVRNTASRVMPWLDTGPQAGAGRVDTTALAKAPAGPPGLQARPRRPRSTVIVASGCTVEKGRIRVKDPGHVQFQPSARDLSNNPGLALGHGAVKDHAQREDIPIRGQLADGQAFSGMGVRNRAHAAGADAFIDPKLASHVIDHGDMTLLPRKSAGVRPAGSG